MFMFAIQWNRLIGVQRVMCSTEVYLFCGVHVSQFMTMKSAFVQMSIFGGRSIWISYRLEISNKATKIIAQDRMLMLSRMSLAPNDRK